MSPVDDDPIAAAAAAAAEAEAAQAVAKQAAANAVAAAAAASAAAARVGAAGQQQRGADTKIHHRDRQSSSSSGSLSSSDVDLDKDVGPDYRTSVADTLVDASDIFGITVYSLISGTRGWKLAQVLASFWLSTALQFVILALLWFAVVRGTWLVPEPAVSDTDKLWLQMGMVQRQLCWLGNNAVINPSGPGTAGDCMLAWPSDAGCALTNRSNVFSRAEQAQALHNLTSEYGMAAACYRNASAEQFAALNCSTFLEETLDPGTYQFGAGLFSNETGSDSKVRFTRGGWAGGGYGRLFVPHQQCLLTPEDITDDVQYDPTKDPMFADLLTFMILSMYTHDEFLTGAWLAYVAVVHIGCVPQFWIPEKALRSYKELRWHSEVLPKWLASCMLMIVPVLQMLTALFVQVSAAALSMTIENQSDFVAAIIILVALVFVLDLDNRTGALLIDEKTRVAALEPPPADGASGVDAALAGTSPAGASKDVQLTVQGDGGRSSSGTRNFFSRGAVVTYLGLLGLLLLIEPIFFSVQLGALLFANGKMQYELSKFDPSTFDGDKTALWDLIVGWFQGGTANAGWTKYAGLRHIEANDPINLMIGLAILFPFLVALFTLLYCRSPIPCRSRVWCLVLLLCQVFLSVWPHILLWTGPIGWGGFYDAATANMQATVAAMLPAGDWVPDVYGSSAGWLAAQIIVFLLPILVAWVVLFLLWPIMFSHSVRSGNSGSLNKPGPLSWLCCKRQSRAHY